MESQQVIGLLITLLCTDIGGGHTGGADGTVTDD